MKVAVYGQAYQGQDADAVFELLDELRKVESHVAIEADFKNFLAKEKSVEDPIST